MTYATYSNSRSVANVYHDTLELDAEIKIQTVW